MNQLCLFIKQYGYLYNCNYACSAYSAYDHVVCLTGSSIPKQHHSFYHNLKHNGDEADFGLASDSEASYDSDDDDIILVEDE